MTAIVDYLVTWSNHLAGLITNVKSMQSTATAISLSVPMVNALIRHRSVMERMIAVIEPTRQSANLNLISRFDWLVLIKPTRDALKLKVFFFHFLGSF